MAVSGDQTNAIPTPITMNGNTSRQIGVVGVVSNESHVNAIASTEKPKPTTGCGWNLSTISPTIGASRPLTIAIGVSAEPRGLGDSPHTACAKNISGSTIPVAADPITAAPKLNRRKSRSRKMSSGISGSRVFIDCQQMNPARQPMPATSTAHIHDARRRTGLLHGEDDQEHAGPGHADQVEPVGVSG